MLFILRQVNPKKRCDTDLVDRLNYFYTPIMLSLFSLVIGGKTYGRNPLECWLPAQFKQHWEKYIYNLCYVEGTYFVGPNETFPAENKQRRERLLGYYQWFPFLLIGLMILSCLPKIIWSGLNWRSGVHVSSIVEVIINSRTQNEMREVAKELRDRLQSTNGTHVTKMYLLLKFLNVMACLLGLYILSSFLGGKYSFFATLMAFWRSIPWKYSGRFPRVAYCDFHLREQGHMVRHTLQCVMSMNMLNDLIHLMLWMWLSLLSFITFLNFCYWAWLCLKMQRSKSQIEKHLMGTGDLCECANNDFKHEKVKKYVECQMNRDDFTIHKIVKCNCGHFKAFVFIKAMWEVCDKNY